MGWSTFKSSLIPLMEAGPPSADAFASALATQYDLAVRDLSAGDTNSKNPVISANKAAFAESLKNAFRRQSEAGTHLGIFDLIADCFPIYWQGARLSLARPNPFVPPGCSPPGTILNHLCTGTGGSPNSLSFPVTFGTGAPSSQTAGGNLNLPPANDNTNPITQLKGVPPSKRKLKPQVRPRYGNFSYADDTNATLVFCLGGIDVNGRKSGEYMYDYFDKTGGKFHLYVANNSNVEISDYEWVPSFVNQVGRGGVQTVWDITPKKKVLYLFSGGWKPGIKLLKQYGATEFDKIYLVDIWLGASTSEKGNQKFYIDLARTNPNKVEYIYTTGGATDSKTRDAIAKAVIFSQKEPNDNHMKTNIIAINRLIQWDDATTAVQAQEEKTKEEIGKVLRAGELGDDSTATSLTQSDPIINQVSSPSLRIPFDYGKPLSPSEYLNEIIQRANLHLQTIRGVAFTNAISVASGTPITAPVPWVGYLVPDVTDVLTASSVLTIDSSTFEADQKYGSDNVNSNPPLPEANSIDRTTFEQRAAIPCPKEPLWTPNSSVYLRADIKFYRAAGCIWPATGEYEPINTSAKRLGFTLNPGSKLPEAAPGPGDCRWWYQKNSEYQSKWMREIRVPVTKPWGYYKKTPNGEKWTEGYIPKGYPTPTYRTVYAHKFFADVWDKILDRLRTTYIPVKLGSNEKVPLINAIEDTAGAWAVRNVSTGTNFTNHAWGMSMDINAHLYPFGSKMEVTNTKRKAYIKSFKKGEQWREVRNFTLQDELHYQMGLVIQEFGIIWLQKDDPHHFGLYEYGRGLNAPDLDNPKNYQQYLAARETLKKKGEGVA